MGYGALWVSRLNGRDSQSRHCPDAIERRELVRASITFQKLCLNFSCPCEVALSTHDVAKTAPDVKCVRMIRTPRPLMGLQKFLEDRRRGLQSAAFGGEISETCERPERGRVFFAELSPLCFERSLE